MSLLSDNTTREAGPVIESRVAELRKRRGIAVAELARAAGVSRQTIYSMESGDYVPNTAVSLKLARILESTVEELFQLAPDKPAAVPVASAELIGGDRFAGSPLELCRVGGRLVAVSTVPAPWHLPPADALLVDPVLSTVQLLREETANRLLIAGCDPAASLLARHMARAQIGLVLAPVNSSAALGLLQEGLVHVAGTHLSDDDEEAAEGVAQLPDRVAVFAFASWEQGLVVRRGNPKEIRAVEHLARRGVRLANREPGSGSRQLLDAQLRAAGIAARSVTGYRDAPAAGHLAAAWRVYAGVADCCVATGSAARAFGLDFTPLSSECYRLVIRFEELRLEAVQRLLDTLCQAVFRRELATLCAYDTRQTGKRVA